jgi:hypothetical protein
MGVEWAVGPGAKKWPPPVSGAVRVESGIRKQVALGIAAGGLASGMVFWRTRMADPARYMGHSLRKIIFVLWTGRPSIINEQM